MSRVISIWPFAGRKSRFHSQSVILIVLAVSSFNLTSCDSAMQSVANQTSSKGGSQPSVTVSISPSAASVTAGGTVHFTAAVTNSSNSRVTWSVSAGTITSDGVFTAPSAKDGTSVTVTAKSASGQASANAIATVTPAGARLTVATTKLPAGTTGTSYSTSLSGTGGSLPYRWTLLSGSLPNGLLLDAATGVLSGVTGVSGSFPFSVQVSDASGTTAKQSLTLTMNAEVSSNCGPPLYPCSRTDMQLITATAPPQLGKNSRYYGGHIGAGLVAVDPAYSNRILRVTDGNTDTTRPGESYSSGSSAEKNVTSYDEQLFFVRDQDGRVCLFQFMAGNFSTRFHGCFGNVGNGLDFGYTAANQRAFFSYYQQKLYRFVIDTTQWTITSDPSFNNGIGYFDPDNPNCLNGQIAANHWYTGGSALSSDDSTMIASFGPSQDDNPYYVVWNANKGCQWMNVQTWQVSQGWNTGMQNPVNIQFASGVTPHEQGGIHNAQIDRSGAFGVLTLHHVPSLSQKLFWTIGTNKVDDTCVKCTSHWACDFGVCFWNMGPSAYALANQPIGSATSVSDVDLSSLNGVWGDDVHISHANAVAGQKLIYLAAWQPGSGDSYVGQTWEDELVGVNWDGSMRTIRFNKNWNSGYGGFNGSARCSISRQGNYAICGSDYQMYNLDKGFGNGLNEDTCDHTLSAGQRNTKGCRTDVLLFELR